MTRIILKSFLVGNLFRLFVLSNALDTFLNSNLMKINQGAEQLKHFRKNSTLPKFGDCWTNALNDIQGTCEQLSEKSQARLALKFTRCFIAMTTGELPEKELCIFDDVDCFQPLPEREFQTYTTFYAHTQNICFYLMSQLWHDETEATISSLRSHSKLVSEKLEFAGKLQGNLLEQQREGLKLQRQLVDHGFNLSKTLFESRQTLLDLTGEFRNSTVEHARLLGELFGRVRILHNWFVSEYAFINQVLYYMACSVIILIVTSFHRTIQSRFILFGIMIVNILIEHIFSNAYLKINDIHNDSNIDLFESIWWIRKLFILLKGIAYIWTILTYIDKSELMLKQIHEIRRQNEEVAALLKNMKSSTVGHNRRFYETIEEIRDEPPQHIRTKLFSRAPTPSPSNEIPIDQIDDGKRYTRLRTKMSKNR